MRFHFHRWRELGVLVTARMCLKCKAKQVYVGGHWVDEAEAVELREISRKLREANWP